MTNFYRSEVEETQVTLSTQVRQREKNAFAISIFKAWMGVLVNSTKYLRKK